MSQTLFNSIVSIHNSRFESTFGTGFLVSSEYIITCHHVIESIITSENKVTSNSQFVGVKFVNNNHKYLAELIDFVPLARKEMVQIEVSDVAILRIESLEEEDRNNFAPLSLRYIDGIEFKSFGFSIDRKNLIVENDIGKWVEGKAVNEVANGWVQLNLYNKLDDVREGFSGAPIWDKKEGGVIGIMTISMSPELQAYMMPITLILDKWTNLLNAIKKQNPYKGLEHFGVEDKENFFGREEESLEIAKSLIDSKLYMLYGASGSGKSSLIFAGVIPILNQNKEIEIVTFRPSFQIFDNLVNSFIDLYSKKVGLDKIKEKESIVNSLKMNEVQLSSIIWDILKKSSFTHLIIIIDQFEELFTLNDDKKLQDNFLNHLLNVINSDNKISILISMRIDFLDNLLENKPFTDLLNQNKDKKLGAIDKKLIKDVIEKPAKRYHATFENGLVDKLIEEFNESNLQLPLMEFALQKIWDKMESRTITHESLDKLGGVKGALTNYADNVLEKSLKDKSHIKNIFMKLITPSDKDYNRKVAVLSSFKEKEIEYQVLMKLARSRLINIEEETVEITHEVLIRKWKTLRKWIKENEEFLIWKKSIEISRNEYESAKGDLLIGIKLFEAKEKINRYEDVLSQDDKNYIITSIEREKEKKLRFWGIFILIIMSISILSGYAWVKKLEAENERNRAEKNEKKAILEKNKAEKNEKKAIEKTLIANQKTIESQNRLYDSLLHQGFTYLENNEQIKAKHKFANAIKENVSKEKINAKMILKAIPHIELINILENKEKDIKKFNIDNNRTIKTYKQSGSNNIQISQISINKKGEEDEIKYFHYIGKTSHKLFDLSLDNKKLLMLKNNYISLIYLETNQNKSIPIKEERKIYDVKFSNDNTKIIGIGKSIVVYDIKEKEKISQVCDVDWPQYKTFINEFKVDPMIIDNELLFYNYRNLYILDLRTCNVSENLNTTNKDINKALFLKHHNIRLVALNNDHSKGILNLKTNRFISLKNNDCERLLKLKRKNNFLYSVESCLKNTRTNLYLWNYKKWFYSRGGYITESSIKEKEINLEIKPWLTSLIFGYKYLLTTNINGEVGLWYNYSNNPFKNEFINKDISEKKILSFNHNPLMFNTAAHFLDNEQSILTIGKDRRVWSIKNLLPKLTLLGNIGISLKSEEVNKNNYSKISKIIDYSKLILTDNQSFYLAKLNTSENMLMVYHSSEFGNDIISLWNIQTGIPIKHMVIKLNNNLLINPNNYVTFVNKDKWILIKQNLNELELWDIKTKKRIFTLYLDLNYDDNPIEAFVKSNKLFVKTRKGKKYSYNLIDKKLSFLKKCYPLKIEVETGTRFKNGILDILSKNEWQEKKKKYEEVLRTKNDDLCQ